MCSAAGIVFFSYCDCISGDTIRLFLIRPVKQGASGLPLHNSPGNKRNFELWLWYVCCNLDFCCHTVKQAPVDSLLIIPPSHFLYSLIFTVHLRKTDLSPNQYAIWKVLVSISRDKGILRGNSYFLLTQRSLSRGCGNSTPVLLKTSYVFLYLENV